MIDEYDDFEDDQPVTRISANPLRNENLGNHILKQAAQYLEDISAEEHGFLIQSLEDLSKEDGYFQVLADQLDQPIGAKVANDALNFIYFWQMIQDVEDPSQFKILDIIKSAHFKTEMLKAFDALALENNVTERRAILLESLELYKLGFYAGCTPMLYAQLEGLLTEVLLQRGYLKQTGLKFVDVHKIVPGLKGNEIKSLWHKSKIAFELNPYFAELNAYKMDTSSDITATRHNILHGTDVNHFSQGRCFILFIWLFSAVSYMSTLK